ncbi:MAG: hypothetical protein B7Y33_02680, partial [Hydrogenophilales bacterium 16-62-9]
MVAISTIELTVNPLLARSNASPASTAPDLCRGSSEHVLIVEAQNATRSLLEALTRTLAPGVIVDHFDDPLNALTCMQQITPDLIIADYRLTGMSGIELIRQVRAVHRLADVPLIIVTVAEDRQIRSDALASGASDFLSRPIDPQEFRVRCLNLLALRRSQKQVAERAKWLEDQVMAATREVRTRERETLLRLAKAGEYRDQDTGNHIIRMAKYARLIAEELTLTTMEC